MKKVCVLCVISLIVVQVYCQLPLKRQTGQLSSIVPYRIQVSDLATTILLFPFEVKEADLGVGELLATKIPDVKNVLKLKAEKPTLDTTSLYVCTTDGKVHVFEVTYTARPQPMAYELTETGIMTSTAVVGAKFDNPRYDDQSMLDWISKVNDAPVTQRKTKRRLGIAVSLTGVYSVNDLLFLRFSINNNSSLPYLPGWSQFVLKDTKSKKRNAVQELPVAPYYQSTLQEIDGESKDTYFFAIPRQTVPPGKKMLFEIHEVNGGRNIIFHIKNKYLLRAKKI